MAIVSVHVPKTGGTSLTTQIREGAFGAYFLDYEDRPRSRDPYRVLRRQLSRLTVPLRAGRLRRYGIIHGHFPADKYRAVADAYIIFLRDPVSRLLSHYAYWKFQASKNPVTVRNNPLIREVAEGRMDLVELAHWQQDFYRMFLAGIPVRDFDVVGITEEFETSIALLNRRFGVSLRALRERAGERFDPGRIDPAVLAYNEENYHYYREACARFEELKRELLSAG